MIKYKNEEFNNIGEIAAYGNYLFNRYEMHKKIIKRKGDIPFINAKMKEVDNMEKEFNDFVAWTWEQKL